MITPSNSDCNKSIVYLPWIDNNNLQETNECANGHHHERPTSSPDDHSVTPRPLFHVACTPCQYQHTNPSAHIRGLLWLMKTETYPLQHCTHFLSPARDTADSARKGMHPGEGALFNAAEAYADVSARLGGAWVAHLYSWPR